MPAADEDVRSAAAAAEVKACCAAIYQSDYVRLLLGDSLHPGGAELTRHLGEQLGLGPADHVLDVASGAGTSAFVLADTFGCRVTGVEYGAGNVAEANARTHPLCEFHQADAERLPFEEGSFDAVISECAFCIFPDKPAAAAEMFRVLRPGGRLGLTDITLQPERVPEGLRNLLGVVACIGDARPVAEYRQILGRAGFVDFVEEDQSRHLSAMVQDIKKKIDLARLAAAIKQIDVGGVDLDAARQMALQARQTIEDGVAGYVLLAAKKRL
jgi:ubiquinone/menaquinone biosynthesis C-methylase UbiE